MAYEVHEIIPEVLDTAFRLIVRIVGDRDEARDLTQEAILKVMTGHGRLRDKSRMKAYIYRTAVNLALNARRNRTRRRTKLLAASQAPGGATARRPDVEFESAEQSLLLAEAVSTLARKQREVVLLRFYGQATFSEISGVLKISEGSAKVHLVRALRNLKKRLVPLLKEEYR
ncbi:MAG: sigma-70 family RNA polymerase sigma factor [Candidatus Zixiibacteriota bacterium]|nr:MAG: sigma-70 family RNA polymerase sigma factor [candidate division Zixibacteria bacterium]